MIAHDAAATAANMNMNMKQYQIMRQSLNARNKFRVQLVSPDALPPVRGSAGAAWYDIYSPVEATVPARGHVRIQTGLIVVCPPDHYVHVAPRSSLALKRSLDVGAGIVDYDSRGQFSVLLFNHSDQEYKIQKHERIAQIILEKISTPDMVMVQWFEPTERGTGGFGSTVTEHDPQQQQRSRL